MHRQSFEFLKRGRALAKKRPKVIEFGSRNINGSPRIVFNDTTAYVGVDFADGDGVDHVMLAHDYHPRELFDVGICVNVLEHDPYWRQTLRKLVTCVNPSGGLLLVGCASTGYREHRHEESPKPGHYRNVDPGELIDWVESLWPVWDHLEVRYTKNKEAELIGIKSAGS